MAEPAKKVTDYNSRDERSPSYWKQDGAWYLHLPDSREDPEFGGLTANLAGHEIAEHEDGTISARPSILVSQRRGEEEISRHGYLTRGVWEEC